MLLLTQSLRSSDRKPEVTAVQCEIQTSLIFNIMLRRDCPGANLDTFLLRALVQILILFSDCHGANLDTFLLRALESGPAVVSSSAV